MNGLFFRFSWKWKYNSSAPVWRLKTGAEDFSAAQLRAGALPLDTEVDGFKNIQEKKRMCELRGKSGM